jgi:hypothetical protein
MDRPTVKQSRIDFWDEDVHRHWSPDSEPYAPADVLLQYLKNGWNLEKLVAVETVYYAGYRRSDIYYFTLEHDGQSIEMPILANPAVFRVIEQNRLTTLRINVDRESLGSQAYSKQSSRSPEGKLL